MTFTPSRATPEEIDTQLAKLYRAAGQAEQRVAAEVVKIRYALGERAVYVGRRQEWRTSPAEAIAAARTRGDERVPLAAGYCTFTDLVARHAAAVKALDEIEAQAEPLNAEFERRGGWSRFFTVQAHNGHIHESMSCKTCNRNGNRTAFQWNPELSGLTEADAVAKLGPSLCTVCFPSAPVEWTEGRPAADHCPGSGHSPAPRTSSRVGSRTYAQCSRCQARPLVNLNGTVRKHKPEQPAPATAETPTEAPAEQTPDQPQPTPAQARYIASAFGPDRDRFNFGFVPSPYGPTRRVHAACLANGWIESDDRVTDAGRAAVGREAEAPAEAPALPADVCGCLRNPLGHSRAEHPSELAEMPCPVAGSLRDRCTYGIGHPGPCSWVLPVDQAHAEALAEDARRTARSEAKRRLKAQLESPEMAAAIAGTDVTQQADRGPSAYETHGTPVDGGQTVADLRAIAGRVKIAGAGDMVKNELIHALNTRLQETANVERGTCTHDGRPIARRTDRPGAAWHHDDDQGGRVCANRKTQAAPATIDGEPVQVRDVDGRLYGARARVEVVTEQHGIAVNVLAGERATVLAVGTGSAGEWARVEWDRPKAGTSTRTASRFRVLDAPTEQPESTRTGYGVETVEVDGREVRITADGKSTLAGSFPTVGEAEAAAGRLRRQTAAEAEALAPPRGVHVTP